MMILHTCRKIIGGYGRLYNWWCTQPQYTNVKYGYLYNWYAATDARGICASNAHLLSKIEWDALLAYIADANKLKESGFTHWLTPNTGATNEFSFYAVGGGDRDVSGIFANILFRSFMWTSLPRDATSSYRYRIVYSGTNAYEIQHNTSGCSIRLIVDSPIEINGTQAIYVGNDLRRYKCVLINNIWYLAENLAETKYRNGDLIAKVTDNAAWSLLETGGYCAYDNNEANAFKTVSIAPVGWHVPTDPEIATLQTYLGGSAIGGGKLKETGFAHWLTPNTGATNEFAFNAIAGGYRGLTDGVFQGLKSSFKSHILNSSYTYSLNMDFNSDDLVLNYLAPIEIPYTRLGLSIRLIKDDSTFTPGDTLTDFDGNVYPLVKIGTQVWMAANLKVSKLNDGTPIPLIEDNAAWAALTTGAQCVYNNDISNL